MPDKTPAQSTLPTVPKRRGRAPFSVKPPTEAELQQRRDRAAKSTGPRTEEGKSRASRNAWKHGMNSAAARVSFAQSGAASMAQMFGKPCLTTCPHHPDNPNVDHPCSLVVEGLTSAGGNCLDKTVYVNALAALADAMESNELQGVHAMLAAEGAKVMQLLHELMSEITTKGLMIPIPMVTKEGVIVRDELDLPVIVDYKPNPMIPAYIKLLENFGISLPEMLATPQARQRAKTGEQAVDTFQALLGGIMSRTRPGGGQPEAIEHEE